MRRSVTELWRLEGPRGSRCARGSLLASIFLRSRSSAAWKPAVASIPCQITKRSPGGVAGCEFLAEREKLARLWQILLESVKQHGGGPMGYAALSAQRLAQGVPWFGYDFGEKQIPHEAGLEASHISYTKGCYTGQEIVERVRSRGQVNRRRVDLIFEGAGVPAAGRDADRGRKRGGFCYARGDTVVFVARDWDGLRAQGPQRGGEPSELVGRHSCGFQIS